MLACCIQVLFHFSLFCETHQLALWYSDCMKNRRRAPGAGILFVLTLPPSQRLEQATRPPHYADDPCFSLQPFFSWSYTFLHPSLTSDQPPDQKDAHSTIVGSAQSIARVRLKAKGPEDGVQQSGSLDAGRSQGREIFGTRTKKGFLGEE